MGVAQWTSCSPSTQPAAPGVSAPTPSAEGRDRRRGGGPSQVIRSFPSTARYPMALKERSDAAATSAPAAPTNHMLAESHTRPPPRGGVPAFIFLSLLRRCQEVQPQRSSVLRRDQVTGTSHWRSLHVSLRCLTGTWKTGRAEYDTPFPSVTSADLAPSCGSTAGAHRRS